MTVKGTNISMTRGDSETLTVTCPEDPFTKGDRLTMTVRESVDSAVVLRKEVTAFDGTGEAVFVLRPEDTDPLDFGDYVYDIQLDRADGTVTTLVKVSKFTVEEEVTYG